MSSIFSKIVTGEIPCYEVAENENFIDFLDIFPLAQGHTVVIPKKETDYIFDMQSDEYKELWAFAQKVAKAQKKVIPCERIGVVVIGLEVPHVHIHLIPINEVSDIDFSKPKLQFTKEEMKSIASDIASLL